MVIISKSEQRKIKAIEKIIQQSFTQKQLPDGNEICRIQLFHLANDIKNTEINHDIDEYLPAINETLANFSKEELIKVFSVEFTRFHNYYQNAPDLSVQESNSSRESSSAPAGGTRYFINIGSKDGLDWKLKDLLKEELNLGRDEVYKVDVMGSFSFFNTDENLEKQVLETFNNYEYQGRGVNVEVTKDKSDKGGGRGKKFRKPKGKPGFKSDRSKKPGRKKNIEGSIKRRRSKR